MFEAIGLSVWDCGKLIANSGVPPLSAELGQGRADARAVAAACNLGIERLPVCGLILRYNQVALFGKRMF